MSQKLRRLSVAANTGRVAAVFLEDDTVVALKMSRAAAQTPQNAARVVQSWITGFRPHHMIVEDPITASRKGDQVKAVLSVIATTFEDNDGIDIRFPRVQSCRNKYIEAKILRARYPTMNIVVPRKPPIWKSEPRNMSYFEALSFVEQLRSDGPENNSGLQLSRLCYDPN